ncbi:hypothetical protein IFM89_035685 [Coptis chinensis]|uniref:Uncharacterized protein n=1 Tax=Coptis chinensis TaxID=261450 RepID=A0A835IPY4_9MAGN|nr:hypothetical protein IFM89_035685 [Coptis chinensis]
MSRMVTCFGTSLGVYSTLIFLILLGRAVLVILGSAISSVFNKMYGFPRITYNDQVSSSGMTTSHLLVAVAFYWKVVVEEGSRSYGVMGILSLVGLVSFVVFFSLGIGVIPWVIMSEFMADLSPPSLSRSNPSTLDQFVIEPPAATLRWLDLEAFRVAFGIPDDVGVEFVPNLTQFPHLAPFQKGHTVAIVGQIAAGLCFFLTDLDCEVCNFYRISPSQGTGNF